MDFQQQFPNLNGFYFDFDTQLSNNILHKLQRSFQEMSTNKLSTKTLLIFIVDPVASAKVSVPQCGTFCAFLPKIKDVVVF